MKAARDAFTFVEVLAAMVFLGILMPAVISALLTANRAAVAAERSTIAAQLGENKLGEFTVGKDGTWSWPIGGALVTEGDHTYELRAIGGTAGSGKLLNVNVAKDRPTASNAKCPCRLRITSLEKQNIQDAAITLYKDGKVVEVGADPQVFGNLEEGEYTYTVTAPGFETFSSGKASAPKNKNISVYLKPVRR